MRVLAAVAAAGATAVAYVYWRNNQRLLARVAVLQQRIAELEQQVIEHEREARAKDAGIDEQSAAIQELRAIIDRRSVDFAERSERRRAAIEEGYARREAESDVRAAKRRAIASLEEQLAALRRECMASPNSVEALATAITAGCAAVAGVLFANAIGV